MEQIVKKEKFINILKQSLIVFLLLQPLFDIYMAIVRERLDVFGFSLMTIIRIAFVAFFVISAIIMFIKDCNNKKDSNSGRVRKNKRAFILLVIYTVVLLVYLLGHHLNITLGNGYYISEGLYNVITETAYVLRISVPIYLIFAIYLIGIKKDDIKEALIYSFMMFSIIMVVTNLFKVAFVAYSEENDLVTHNIIEWFTKDIKEFFKLTSKGFFTYANEISVVLSLSYPIIVYTSLKENKWQYYLTVITQFAAMIMLGTRVSTWIAIGVMVATIILYGIYIIITKSKHVKRFIFICLSFIFGLILYFNSPQMNRVFTEDYELEYNSTMEIIEKESEENRINIRIDKFKKILKNEEKLKDYAKEIGFEDVEQLPYKDLKYMVMCKYIEENYRYNYVAEVYIEERYPYEDDPEFWLYMFEQPFAVKADNRGRQIEITKRIFETSGNFVGNVFFGIGSTPLNERGMMVERDYVAQYYQLGIIGMILFILPYIVILVYASIKYLQTVLKDKKVDINLKLIYIGALFIMLIAAYFSGRTFEQYIISLYGATIAGVLLVEYCKVEGEEFYE